MDIIAELASRCSCSCGKCVEGIMSEWMAYELSYQANICSQDILADLCLNWRNFQQARRRPYTNLDLLATVRHLSYLPVEVREANVNYIFIKNYANILASISSSFQQKIIPTPSYALWMPAVGQTQRRPNSYIRLGGKIEYILDMLLNYCETPEKASFRPDQSSWDDFYEKIEKLPRCNNDSNYALMRGFLLSSENGATVLANGPYYEDDDLEAMVGFLQEESSIETEQPLYSFDEHIGGVMTPRMGHELYHQALTGCQNLEDRIERSWDTYQEHRQSGGLLSDQVYTFPELEYIPFELRDRTADDKDFKLGFANILFYIAICLERETIPTVNEVMKAYSEEPTGTTATYLQKSGKVEYAFDYVFSVCAKHRSSGQSIRDGPSWHNSQNEKKELADYGGDNTDFERLRNFAFSIERGTTVGPNGPYPSYGILDDQKPEFFQGFTDEQHEQLEALMHS